MYMLYVYLKCIIAYQQRHTRARSSHIIYIGIHNCRVCGDRVRYPRPNNNYCLSVNETTIPTRFVSDYHFKTIRLHDYTHTYTHTRA